MYNVTVITAWSMGWERRVDGRRSDLLQNVSYGHM